MHRYESKRLSVQDSSVPTSKGEAIRLMRSDGVMPSVGKFGNKILEYFQLIGADQKMPTEREDLKGYIMRWHCHVCILNDLFPADMPYGFVYNHFFNAVIQNKVEIKGYNVRAQIAAFNEWWQSRGNWVREQYNIQHPGNQPKQIGDSSNKTPEQELAAAERTLLKMKSIGFPEDAIEKQRKQIEKLKAGN